MKKIIIIFVLLAVLVIGIIVVKMFNEESELKERRAVYVHTNTSYRLNYEYKSYREEICFEPNTKLKWECRLAGGVFETRKFDDFKALKDGSFYLGMPTFTKTACYSKDEHDSKGDKIILPPEQEIATCDYIKKYGYGKKYQDSDYKIKDIGYDEKLISEFETGIPKILKPYWESNKVDGVVESLSKIFAPVKYVALQIQLIYNLDQIEANDYIIPKQKTIEKLNNLKKEYPWIAQ